MQKEKYVQRIASATPVQLTIITHELIIAFLKEALSAKDKSLADAQIERAKNAVQQLIDTLNFKVEISQGLYDLYLYAGEILNRVYFKKDADLAELRPILEMFTTMLAGWKAIENTPDERGFPDEEEAPPDVSASQGPQVFAGLTYGREGLAEYVEESDGRGYRV